MDDIEPTLKILQDALLRKLGPEVDLIFQYGSRLRGTTNRYSDGDLSYVPAHEDTWDSITVMVGDTLFDLYPMHWSKLEHMAEFRDVSASVLLHNQVRYQRSAAVAERFAALAERLRALQKPEARPEMVRRALEIFQGIGYDYYLLQTQACAGHVAGSLKQSQVIFRTILHCLAACNQACVDTRKMEQVLALPDLPSGFARAAQYLIDSFSPGEQLAATDALLKITRSFLLEKQRQVLRTEAAFSDVFDSAYPELKRDLQGILLACERRNRFALKTSLFSLLHEMSRGIAQATGGVAYSSFNGLAEYEQNLAALGFPPLLPCLEVGDFDELHRRCLLFDQRLRAFLAERSTGLNLFATPGELQAYLSA